MLLNNIEGEPCMLFELVLVTVVTITLFVALFVAVRKLNNKKYISTHP